MNGLGAEKVRLRALEPDDVEILYRWENDTAVWGVSHTLLPFSRHVLRQFIAEQAKDIYATRQTRFVIETLADGRPVGVIDLYDFDPHHARAGVGVLVYASDDRRRGYAGEALRLLCDYSFGILGLHQLYAGIPASNTASRRLFERCGFMPCGTQRDWLKTPTGWEDVSNYQRIENGGAPTRS